MPRYPLDEYELNDPIVLDELQREINANRQKIPTDLVSPDLVKPGTEKKPGIFATLENVKNGGKIPTKVDEYPEVNIAQDEQPKKGPQSAKSGSRIGLPPIPPVNVPEFSYPEFKDLYGDEQEDDDLARNRRLLAYLNMAGNHVIKGLTRYDAKNDIPNAMLDSISQDQKAALAKKNRMAEYLKNKYDAYNDNYKLRMQAENMRNNALYKRALIGLKEKQLSQRGESKENAYNKAYGGMAGKGGYEFDRSGGASQGMKLIEETKKIAQELRSNFYGKDGKPLEPGLLDLAIKEVGPGGENWFKVRNERLARFAQKIKRGYLNQIRQTMGPGPITDRDVNIYLGSLFDWALSANANAENLEAIASEMKKKLMTNIAMRKHAIKNNGDMSGFDSDAVPSGDIEILDE